MKRMTKVCMAVAVSLLIGFSAAGLAWSDECTQCNQWNLAADFRIAPNQANPNPDICGDGVWHFMESSSLARDPQSYTLLPLYGSMPIGTEGWEAPFDIRVGLNLPAVLINATGSDLTNGTFHSPAGAISVHPGVDNLVVVGWKSPFTGKAHVKAAFSDQDPCYDDGINWFIDKGTTPLASGSIPAGGAPQTWEMDAIPVTQDEFLYFVVDPRATLSCDSTGLDVNIYRTQW